jgi:hypothetical protein
VQKGTLAAIDNDTRRIDRIRLGALAGLDAGTLGSYYFDDFRATRTSYIGPAAAVAGGEEGLGHAGSNEGWQAEAPVVEEDLRLDDVGMVEEDGQGGEPEETTPPQIFLPLVSR